MMPHRFYVQKLSFKETAIQFGLSIGLVLLAFAFFMLGSWLGNIPSTQPNQPIIFRFYLSILAFGAAGSSIGFSGMMLETVINQLGCSFAILGIIFVILLFSLPVAVVICIYIFFSGVIPAGLW
jgi:hypothetical protein